MLDALCCLLVSVFVFVYSQILFMVQTVFIVLVVDENRYKVQVACAQGLPCSMGRSCHRLHTKHVIPQHG